jgi:hypothetical protein
VDARETGRAEARRPRSDEFIDDGAFVFGGSGVGAALGGSWGFYQIFECLGAVAV